MRSCGILTIPCCSPIRTRSNRHRTTPRRGGGGSRRSRASAFVRPRPCSARRSTCRHHAMETKGMEMEEMEMDQKKMGDGKLEVDVELELERERKNGTGRREEEGAGSARRGQSLPPPPRCCVEEEEEEPARPPPTCVSATTLHRRPSARRPASTSAREAEPRTSSFTHTTVPARSQRPTARRRRNRSLPRPRARSLGPPPALEARAFATTQSPPPRDLARVVVEAVTAVVNVPSSRGARRRVYSKSLTTFGWSSACSASTCSITEQYSTVHDVTISWSSACRASTNSAARSMTVVHDILHIPWSRTGARGRSEGRSRSGAAGYRARRRTPLEPLSPQNETTVRREEIRI